MVPRFFADETDLSLGKALEAAHPGEVVYPGHADLPEVPRRSLDDEWLPVIGRLQLVVVTRDKNIRYRTVERLLWIEHQVRGFVLTGRSSQSTVESLQIIEENWHRISTVIDDRPKGPWMYTVTKGGLRDKRLDPM